MKKTFEQFCKGFLSEQKGMTPEKLRKQERLKIDIGGEKHDPTSPNKSHIEENVPISTPIGSNRRGKKKTSFAYTSLGGAALKSRANAHRQGNQKGQNRYESFELQEVRKVALKKVNEKKNEVAIGSTDTGKAGETINTEPQKSELTGYH